MKNKPMVALQTKMNFSQTLYKVMEFHLFENATIIDPAPGEKHSWNYYLTHYEKESFFPITKFSPVFINDDITSFEKTAQYVEEHGPVDAIFFDPPYIFGHKQSRDVRREDYGDYYYSFEDVQDFIASANERLPVFLKPSGLLFFKYTDVFCLAERKFYFCALLWTQELSNFNVLDHYIIPHHHISPTAWQVKNRPCGIVNYTYLSVLSRR